MRLVPISLLSFHFDIPLAPPLTQRGADLESYAAWLCNSETGLGLRPEQVRLKRWDDLYGYELTAHIFGDNGLITRLPDRVRVVLRNARTAADWELFRRVLVRFYTRMNFSPLSITAFSAHVHSRLPAADELEAFFRQFPQHPMASKPALFTYAKITDWEADIRMVIEKSNALPDALFLWWETTFLNSQDWESFITSLPAVLENSAHRFDLSFMPMH